jgi:hypothetical protein
VPSRETYQRSFELRGYRIIEDKRKGLDLVTFKDDEMLIIRMRDISSRSKIKSHDNGILKKFSY